MTSGLSLKYTTSFFILTNGNQNYLIFIVEAVLVLRNDDVFRHSWIVIWLDVV